MRYYCNTILIIISSNVLYRFDFTPPADRKFLVNYTVYFFIISSNVYLSIFFFSFLSENFIHFSQNYRRIINI